MKHEDYYNHFDAKKDYERTLFLASGSKERVLQSAELNELQDRLISQRKQVADSLFKNGDLIEGEPYVKDGKLIVPQCKVYADGAVRTVGPVTFEARNMKVGIKRSVSTVTFEQDKSLGDPVKNSETSGMEGAAREKVKYSFTSSGFNHQVFEVSGSKVFCRSVKDLSLLSQASPEIIVSKSGHYPTLREALENAQPRSRILVKDSQYIKAPYEVKTDDLTIEIDSGVCIEIDPNMGFDTRGAVVDEVWKRSVFHCKAKHTLIRGGLFYVRSHSRMKSQYLAAKESGASVIVTDAFVVNLSRIDGDQGVHSDNCLKIKES